MKLPLGTVQMGHGRCDIIDADGNKIGEKFTADMGWSFIKGYYQALADNNLMPDELKGIENRSHLDTSYPKPPAAVIETYRRQ